MLIYSMCVFGDGGNMDRKSNLGFCFVLFFLMKKTLVNMYMKNEWEFLR